MTAVEIYAAALAVKGQVAAAAGLLVVRPEGIDESPLPVEIPPVCKFPEVTVMLLERPTHALQPETMGAVFRPCAFGLHQPLMLEQQLLGPALELRMFREHRRPDCVFWHGTPTPTRLVHGGINLLHQHDDPAAVLGPSDVRQRHA